MGTGKAKQARVHAATSSVPSLRKGSDSLPSHSPLSSFHKRQFEAGNVSSLSNSLHESGRANSNRVKVVHHFFLKDISKTVPAHSSVPANIAMNRRTYRDFGSTVPQQVNETRQKYKWVIMPRSTWKIRWDLWIGLIILYSVTLIPYRIGFGVDAKKWEQMLNYVFDSSFGMDIIFNFFTGYYDDIILIQELPKIRARYLRSWFLFDIVSTVPWEQLLEFVSTAESSLLSLKLLRTFRLFRLLKLMRLLRLKRAVETVQMDALNAHVLQTFKSLAMIIFIIHLLSCGWYMFYTWDPTGPNWVTFAYPDGLTDSYLVSFYWVSNTMMSVGYGDIYAVTDGERIYSIFVEALGSICVGLIIANIQLLTENYNSRGIHLKQKLQETKEFLLNRNIPRWLRQRVLSQFEYHWSRRTLFDEDHLLKQFPKSLQYEILAASMELFVNRFPFFGVTSVEFFVFTIPRLRPIVLGPGQTLVDAESVWEELYFLTEGTVESIRANVVVGSLSAGDICGIECLVENRKRYTHTYRSILKTQLYAIHSTDLLEAIAKCPIAEKYLMDLAVILNERYAESARRGHRIVQKQVSQQHVKRQNPRFEPFLQYRHRKSYNSINTHDINHARKTNITAATDEVTIHWSVIRHYSKLRIIWDVLIGIMVAITAIMVPFRISFDVTDTVLLTITDRLLDVLFCFDVFLSFLTTYVDDTGVEILDRHEIRRNYLKTTFVVDVASSIPFDFIVESVTTQAADYRSLKLFRTLKLIKLLRLMRLSKLFKMNSQWTSELEISMDTIRLLKLIAPVTTIMHYVGCFWYYMSAGNTESNAWWGRIYFDDPNSIISKYIASIYWAATTMTTVGFGDIYAVNSYEQTYSILVMIGGTTLFAYVVGTVIEVVSNSKSLMNREREMVQKMNAYIKERGVPREFILACQEHLRFLNGERTLFDEQGLFNALSYSLRSELILYLNNDVLAKIRFFDKKPKWFLTLLLPRLVPQYFLSGDLLIYQDNPVSGIFFIMSGEVVVKSPYRSEASHISSSLNSVGRSSSAHGIKPDQTGEDIATLCEGEFFGYKEVLTYSVAFYNVIASKPTGTYMLSREFFESLEAEYPFVMNEVRLLVMHSINKQQTIVQHWHNNDAIGISGEEKEFIMTRSSSIEEIPRYGDRSFSSKIGSRFGSIDRTNAQMDPMSIASDEVSQYTENDDVGEIRGPSVSDVEVKAQDMKSNRLFTEQSLSTPTETNSIAPPSTTRGFLCPQGTHSASVSSGPASSNSLPNRISNRRSSFAVSTRNIGNFPPPLNRNPSMPEEINAIVNRLLLFEGYQLPGLEGGDHESNINPQ